MKWFGTSPSSSDGTSLPLSRIETLEQILKSKIDGAAVIHEIHRFSSRKNVVIQLKIRQDKQKYANLVAKMFIHGNYGVELSILENSWKHRLAVPEVIDARDNVILMSCISGQPLVETINRTFEPHLISLLAQWYYNFHSIHNKIKGDSRLRNFIYNEGTLYGVDFEEACSGSWMLDIGGIGASLIDTNPIFDQRKIRLAWRLLDSYLSLRGLKKDRAMENEFNRVIADTLKQTSILREDTRILEISEKILTEGLPND